MWKYAQSTGTLASPGGVTYQGYSGAEPFGLNNPLWQNVPNVGPIPQGTYTIGAPEDTIAHGPFALPLIPFLSNVMFGRSDFLMHGDEVDHPGQHLASEGCVIMALAVRQAVWASGDRLLAVFA